MKAKKGVVNVAMQKICGESHLKATETLVQSFVLNARDRMKVHCWE